MPNLSPLDHKYRLTASNPGSNDFCDLLEEETKSIADVRKKLDIELGQDSLEARQAIAFYLTKIIDKIKRTRKNITVPGVSDDDNEYN